LEKIHGSKEETGERATSETNTATLKRAKGETRKQTEARVVVSPTFNAAIVERRIVGSL